MKPTTNSLPFPVKRSVRPNPKTLAERAEEFALREYYQREKPGPQDHGEAPVARAQIAVRALVLRLKFLRQELGLSLAAVARRSGLDKAALCRLENGSPVNPTSETLWRYAWGLGQLPRLELDPVPEKASRVRRRK